MRFFLIFLVGIIITSLVGLSNFDNAFAQSDTGVLTLDPFPRSGEVGDIITFTGTLKLYNASPEGEVVYIKDKDTDNPDDLLATAYVESNGKFSASWIVKKIDPDNDLEIYAFFEGNDVLNRLTTCDNESTTSYKEQCPNTIRFIISPSLPPPLSLIPKSEPPRSSETHMELYYSLTFDTSPLVVIFPDSDSYDEVSDHIEAVRDGIRIWESLLQQKFGGDWKVNIIEKKPGIKIPKADIHVNLVSYEEDDACGKDYWGKARTNGIKPVQTWVCSTSYEQKRSITGVAKTTAHEFIHAVGLGHAFNSEGDLMCSKAYENGKWVPTCPDRKSYPKSPSDFNLVAIETLYGLDGFKNPNKYVEKRGTPFYWSDYLKSGFAYTAQPTPTPTPTPQPPPTTPQPQLPVYISISTDKGTYQDRDTIVVTGKVYNFQKNLASTLIMADPSNKLKTISQFQLDDKGKFRILFPLSQIKMDSSGTYSLTLYHGVTSEKTYFSYTIPSEITQPTPVTPQQPTPVNPQPPESPVDISVKTDKETYRAGDIITIKGKINNPKESDPVLITLSNPSGQIILQHQVFWDEKNKFTTSFVTSKNLMSIKGSYSITVNHYNAMEKKYFSYSIPSETTQPPIGESTPKPSITTNDFDGDGIPDDEDTCREKPEDYNGYIDWDGCPDKKDLLELKEFYRNKTLKGDDIQIFSVNKDTVDVSTNPGRQIKVTVALDHWEVNEGVPKGEIFSPSGTKAGEFGFKYTKREGDYSHFDGSYLVPHNFAVGTYKLVVKSNPYSSGDPVRSSIPTHSFNVVKLSAPPSDNLTSEKPEPKPEQRPEPKPTCGPGTVLKNGVCVVEESNSYEQKAKQTESISENNLESLYDKIFQLGQSFRQQFDNSDVQKKINESTCFLFWCW